MQQPRMLLCLVASILTISSAGKVKIEATNLCDDDCTLKDVVLDFPESIDALWGAKFNFSVKADMMRNMSFSWRHWITVQTGPSFADIEVWNSTGVPCGYTFAGDPVWLQLGINFPDCHATAGHVEMFGAVKFHGIVVPGVPVDAYVHMWDDLGKEALKMRVRLHHPLLRGGSVPEVTLRTNVPQESLIFPRTEITARDCCDQNCRLKNVSLNFPHHLDGFGMKFSVHGHLEEKLSNIRYNVHGSLEVLDVVPKFTVLVANGSLCGNTTISDHTEFEIGLDPGTCPFAAGRYSLAGWTWFTIPFDWLGNVSLRVEVVEENSDERVACADVNLHLGLSKSDKFGALPLLV